MPKSSFIRGLSCGAGLLAATELTAWPARACSYPSPDFGATYRAATSVEVPTNAVLLVHGRVPGPANGPTLLDAAGNAVPFDVRAVAREAFDLIPRDELEPNQSYRFGQLEHLDSGEGLEFTTGSGPAAPSAHLDPPDVEAWMLDYNYATCGMVHGLCIDATLPAGTTLEVHLAGEVLSYGTPDLPNYRQILPDIVPDDCLEVRLRDVRGNRSAPSVFCSDTLRRFELEGDRYDVSYDCTNYESYVLASDDRAQVPADAGPEPGEPAAAAPHAERLASANLDVTGSDAAVASATHEASSGCSLQRRPRFTAESLAAIVAALGLALHRRRSR